MTSTVLGPLPPLCEQQKTRVLALLRVALWQLQPDALLPAEPDIARTETQAAWLSALRLVQGQPATAEADAQLAQARTALQELLQPTETPQDRLDVALALLDVGEATRLAVTLVVALALVPEAAQVAQLLAPRIGRNSPHDIVFLDAVLACAGLGPAWLRTQLHDSAPLRHLGVLTVGHGQVQPSLSLLAFLQGFLPEASPLSAFATPSDLPEALLAPLAQLRTGWIDVLERTLRGNRPALVSGMQGFGGVALVQALADRLQVDVRTVDVGAIFDLERGLPTELLPALHCEARLSPSLWAVTGCHQLDKSLREHPLAARRLVEDLVRIGRPLVLVHEGPVAADLAARLAREAGLPHLEVPALNTAQRTGLLDAVLQASGVALDDASELAGHAGHFSLGAEHVASAVAFALQKAGSRAARALADGQPLDLVLPTLGELRLACTTAMTSRLRQYGSRVDTVATWEDLVLTPETLSQVKDLARFARVRDRLFDDYGFGDKQSYGRALSAMFSGPSGTGKTMVAGLIAKDLGVELYRVDLSRVVSKYIGETEERLGSLFSEATQVGAALLFDEADSLFGARTEIKSSNDRYANLEVNYLLQRLEEYDGVVILTTNFAASIDEAFLRRLRFRVQFPLPTPKERAKLWEIMVPSRMPIAEDGLDFDWMGETFELTGGHVRNAVLRAGMIAADADKPMSMRMFYDAAATEYKELGKLAPAYPFDDDW